MGNKWVREEHQGFREEFEIFKEENLWLREISLRYCEIEVYIYQIHDRQVCVE